MCQRQYKLNGFTFIELILYVAIIENGVKSSTQQETISNTRYVAEKIKYEIRNANGINTGTSNFGVNLASNSSYQLSLQGNAPNNPIVINVLGGVLQIKYGAASPISLHSVDTKITDLTLSDNSSLDSKTKNITFTLTVVSNYTGTKQEYTDTVSLRSSAEIRSN